MAYDDDDDSVHGGGGEVGDGGALFECESGHRHGLPSAQLLQLEDLALADCLLVDLDGKVHAALSVGSHVHLTVTNPRLAL